MTARLRRLCLAAGIATLCFVGGAPACADSIHQSTVPPRGAVGHDVGDVSCLGPLPSGGSFGIVGVTAGKPFHESPCLAAEYDWASGLTYRPEYYVNLANPGHKSSHWGHGGPRACHRKPKYDVDCAYDYGYQTAVTAWQYVKSAGSDGVGRWWLDVEVDNSWGTSRAGTAANVADIRGALRYLRTRPRTTAGIYTETMWWIAITDDSGQFSGVPVWGGGADSKHHASRNCSQHSITVGRALLAQWIVGGVDHDIAC